MRKYGIEHFHVSLIEETDNPDEREVYWIEQKQSFKYGYNATLGGDGTHYLDYDLVVSVYQQTFNQAETARRLNCSTDSVKNILTQRQVEIISSCDNQKSKVVEQFNKQGEFIQSFAGLKIAARYLKDNNYAKGEERGVASHIREAAQGKRKTAYGFKWKFFEK